MPVTRAPHRERKTYCRPSKPQRRLTLENLEGRLVLSAVDWIGPSNGSWDVASNWSTGVVPGFGDDVTIDTAAAQTVSIQSGDNITIGSLTTGASDTLSMTGGSLIVTSGASTLSGTLDMTGGALNVFGAGTNLTADGITSIGAAGLGIGSGASVMLAGPSVHQRGIVTLASNSRLQTAGDFTNSGLLSLGNGSTLIVDGNFTQTPTGSLSVEISGSAAAGVNARIAVGKAATLAGTLNVSVVNGYLPKRGDDYQIMTFAAASGSLVAVTTPGPSFLESMQPTSLDLTPALENIASPSGMSVNAFIGTPFNGFVASFAASGPSAQAKDFEALIDWGDGTTSAGNVTAVGNSFYVNGSHDYSHGGQFAITTTIEGGGGAGTITSVALAMPPNGGRIHVTTSADTHAADADVSPEDANGEISLRSALEYSRAINSSLSIDFDPNYVKGPIRLTLGPLEIDQNIAIVGDNIDRLSIDQATPGATRLFQITGAVGSDPSASLYLSGVTLDTGA